jgi:predicted nuclease of predicted toxin-antitoxin system
VRFLCDHDVATDVARVLRVRGYDVVELREALAPDRPDAEVWAYACSQGRVVITCNRADYMTLAAATPVHPGVILLFRRRTHQAEAARLLALLANAGEQGLANNVNFA